MHRGITGKIRKTATGRFLLFHVNTGLFWIYGILTFLLAFSLSGFWILSGSSRCLLSIPIALISAFTLARLVHKFFWRRFQNAWMDNIVIVVLVAAWLLTLYVHDNQDGHGESLLRLATNALTAFIAALLAYVLKRKKLA
jgi:hypothetical protein